MMIVGLGCWLKGIRRDECVGWLVNIDVVAAGTHLLLAERVYTHAARTENCDSIFRNSAFRGTSSREFGFGFYMRNMESVPYVRSTEITHETRARVEYLNWT